MPRHVGGEHKAAGDQNVGNGTPGAETVTPLSETPPAVEVVEPTAVHVTVTSTTVDPAQFKTTPSSNDLFDSAEGEEAGSASIPGLTKKARNLSFL